MSTDTILEGRDIIVRFGSFTAVNAVSLRVKRGTVTGLIGPNGAGKTTLFNALLGEIRPDSGSIYFLEKPITGQSPDQLFSAGLARTFQIPKPFAGMTVFENLIFSAPQQTGERIWGAFFQGEAVRDQERKLAQKASEVLAFTTLDKVADEAAGNLSGGQQKLLELARVLMADPSLILLDEPAAGVNPALTQVLISKIKALNEQGVTFLIIEHDMDFVMRHCDPIIALASGEVIFEGDAQGARRDPRLLDAYLGADADG